MNKSKKQSERFNSVKATPSRKRPNNMITSSVGLQTKRLNQSKTFARLPPSSKQIRPKELAHTLSSDKLQNSDFNSNRHPLVKGADLTKTTRLIEVNLDYQNSIDHIRKVVEKARKKSPPRMHSPKRKSPSPARSGSGTRKTSPLRGSRS